LSGNNDYYLVELKSVSRETKRSEMEGWKVGGFPGRMLSGGVNPAGDREHGKVWIV